MPADLSAHPPTEAPPSPALPTRAFAIVWLLFWLMLATVAVQDHLRQGQLDLWKPLLWEGASCLVATALMFWLWRQVPRQDLLLATPWRWLRRPLLGMLPLALAYVLAVQGLRTGAHLLIGVPYRHDPWPQLLVYETVKFSLFYLLFVGVVFGLRSFAALNAERLRSERQRTLAQAAQTLQLAQQIEPHFLFNALNTIAAVVHEDPTLADRLLTRLSALLRASTTLSRRPLVRLEEEIELLQAYAELMQQRFGDRVTLAFEIEPQARDCSVPALLLQPLLENAYRHGVERHPGPAYIVVAAHREGGQLRLSVVDDIGRLPDDGLRLGVGLGNLKARLALAHGAAAALDLRARPGGGVLAEVRLPCGC